ncbi:MAG: AtpZ/AtpI family protein [bacterium]|nr:AtpZ/AtpI family protein [bacterium]
MGKAAKTRHSADDPVLDYFPVFDPQEQLFVGIINIGWRLALTVLFPIFVGVWADRRFGTEPSLTLVAFFIAIVASCLVIARAYKEVNEQSQNTVKATKKKKSAKNYDKENND